MRKFDFYEFTGILTPGVLLLAGLMYLWPGIVAHENLGSISVGGLGIFTLLAYVAGHLVQAVGNWIETAWWKAAGGMPTDWIRSGKGKLLAAAQLASVKSNLQVRLGLSLANDLSQISPGEWIGITRQIYAAVAGAKRSARVDTFNGNYGLHRGLLAAATVLLGASFFSSTATFATTVLTFVVAVVAATRMHLFGKHYARELFVQFLQIPAVKASKVKSNGHTKAPD